MKMTRLFRNTLLVLTALVGASCIAQASSMTYSSTSRKFAVGVIDANPFSALYCPFYVMNERTDIKPNGWSFYNPLPKDSSSDQQFNYWQVSLNTVSFADIGKYDILLLIVDSGNVIQFDRTQREKLRKFVDGGGTLWIDYNGGTFDSSTNFFLTKLGTTTGSLGFAASFDRNASIPDAVKGHPLIARPFLLTTDAMGSLGGASSIADSSCTQGIMDTGRFSAILVDGGPYAIMGAATYGSGRVVVTANQLVANICKVPGTHANMTTVSYADLLDISSACVELAYNIVNWGAEHTTVRGDVRHTGFSYADIGGGLSKLWTYPDNSGSLVNNSTSPAMLDDLVFYVDSGNTFHIFDLSEEKSRYVAQTSGPMQASANGAAYTEVPVGGSATGHAFGASAKVSSPTAVYVPSSTGISVPTVFLTVQDTSGTKVREFYLDTSTVPAAWKVSADVLILSTAFTGTVPEPVYVDGYLYATDGAGLLNCQDRRSGTPGTQWIVQPQGYGPVSGAPTIGFVRDVTNGAVTQMAYVGTSGDSSGVNGAVLPYPLRVFNEPLTGTAQQGGTFGTRNAAAPVDQNDWSVYMPALISDGNPTGLIGSSATPSTSIYTDLGASYPYLTPVVPNTFSIKDPLFTDYDGLSPHTHYKKGIAFLPLAKGGTAIADYGINPLDTSVLYTYRTPLDVKSKVPSGLDGIVGSPALGSNDIMYFGTKGDGSVLGALYAVREGGRTGTRAVVKWRWCLEDSDVKSMLGGSPVVVGSPAVAKDRVYFAIDNGTNGYIVALQSDPVFRINLGGQIDRNSPVTVSQYDSYNPTSVPIEIGGVPDSVTDPLRTLYATFLVDYDHGTLTFNNFRPNTGAGSDLSTTESLVVKYTPAPGTAGGGQETSITVPAFLNNKPVTTLQGGLPATWNNMVWVLELKPGDRPAGAPVVMGNHLYVGCKAVVPSGGISYADLYSIDVAATESLAQQASSWPLQYTGTNMTSSVYCKDVSGKDIISPVAGANGMMAAVTAEGLTVLQNNISLIADTNRILEVDSAGNLTWSCDSTHYYAQTNNSTMSDVAVSFNHPAVARYAPGSGIVVADTGNNRIVQIDKGGEILWQIVDFIDPKQLLPAGAPMTLSGPQDVSYWVFTPTGTTYPEYHYLISDTENYRVLEVTARFNTTLNQYQNQLDWVTKTLDQGHKYRYTSARRVVQDVLSTYYTECVISNYIPKVASQSDTGIESAGGALVRISNTAGPQDGCIDTNGIISSLSDGTNTIRLSNPIYFDRVFDDAGRTYWDVIVDSGHPVINGNASKGPSVFAVHHKADASVDGFQVYDYAQYTSIYTNGVFNPVSAQFVIRSNGLLIVNRSSTASVGGSSYGEILEVGDWNSSTGLFGSANIIAPNASATSSALTPAGSASPYVPAQPTSAERRPY